MKNRFLFLISITMLIATQVFCEDVIILKSGRKLEGVIVVEGENVKLHGKYGTIIFKKSDVVISKEESVKQIREVKENSAVNTTPTVKLVATELTTKSGRKILGTVYQKDNDLFLVDSDGTIKIDPFILAKKEDLGQNKVKGDVILGENCIVTLKSGRVFAGIVEEFANDYYVSSVIGTVKVEKADVDNIHQTGVVLNLKEEREKLAGNPGNPATPKAQTAVTTVKSNSPFGEELSASQPQEVQNEQIVPVNNNETNLPKVDLTKDLTSEDIQRINKSAEDAIKASKEKTKVIKTLHELH